jgi:phosphatidate cytidylyltransferase
VRRELVDLGRAFESPVTVGLCAAIVALIALALAAIPLLPASAELKLELRRRTLAWAVMAPLILGPVLLGPGGHVAAVTVLSLVCFREYARATGLFRERMLCAVVVLAILAVELCALDHYYGLFTALIPLCAGLIAAAPILQDRPAGYLQRASLGVFGFMLFGSGLAHLAYMGNDEGYRPIVLLVVAGVQLNDVFAFCTGKALGREKLAPATSPNKTVAGALGALALTTAMVAWLGGIVFKGTPLDEPGKLVGLGVLTSVTGQLGDLLLSSIKRDVGIKDMGAVIPGHGGVLDRANSLLLASPAVFHYARYFDGLRLDAPERWLF